MRARRADAAGSTPAALLGALVLAACGGPMGFEEGSISQPNRGEEVDDLEDRDGDGALSDLDCDDTDPAIHPGAVEVVDASDNDCDGRVLVGEGSFIMGSDPEDPGAASNETPEHRVFVGAFLLSRSEITAGDYQACVDAGACRPTRAGSTCNVPAGRWSRPANCLEWSQAKDFCAFVGGRLPTEAEWEKAARGGCEALDGRCDASPDAPDDEGDEAPYPWGDAPPTCALANLTEGDEGCDDPDSPGCTEPVGARPDGASPYGALDMAGNVAEWVEDCFLPGYAATPTDGSAQESCPGAPMPRILRGGSCEGTSEAVRVANRLASEPFDAGDLNGARCAFDT